MTEPTMEKEILRMQIRLFREASKKWKLNKEQCDEIFVRYNIDEYIRDVYEIFHVQGDEANLHDIEEYISNKKAKEINV